jgi:phage protein D
MAGYVGQVVYQVYVNGLPYNNAPMILDGELDQVWGQHDLFTLRIEYPRTYPNINNVTVWPDDTPIQIDWGRKPDVNTWYGYVNHHEITQRADSGTNAMQVEYVCIGTSSVLNPETSRVWQSVSPTYIAKQIARENGFRAVVTPVNWVLEYEVQVSESNFQFLNRIAAKTGLRFWCSGGTLYMVAPDIALYGAGQGAIPSFTSNKLLTQQDTIRQFHLMKGRNLPGAVVANRAVFGVDQATGQVFSAVTNPSAPTSRTIIRNDAVVQNYQDAQNWVQAMTRLSQYWIGASAQLFGSTTLYPGKLITLSGAALPDNMSGAWLVASAEHKLLSSGTANPVLDRYMTDVTIFRNTENASVKLAGSQPISPELVSCSLNKGDLWISNTPGVITETLVNV